MWSVRRLVRALLVLLNIQLGFRSSPISTDNHLIISLAGQRIPRLYKQIIGSKDVELLAYSHLWAPVASCMYADSDSSLSDGIYTVIHKKNVAVHLWS